MLLIKILGGFISYAILSIIILTYFSPFKLMRGEDYYNLIIE